MEYAHLIPSQSYPNAYAVVLWGTILQYWAYVAWYGHILYIVSSIVTLKVIISLLHYLWAALADYLWTALEGKSTSQNAPFQLETWLTIALVQLIYTVVSSSKFEGYIIICMAISVASSQA